MGQCVFLFVLVFVCTKEKDGKEEENGERIKRKKERKEKLSLA